MSTNILCGKIGKSSLVACVKPFSHNALLMSPIHADDVFQMLSLACTSTQKYLDRGPPNNDKTVCLHRRDCLLREAHREYDFSARSCTRIPIIGWFPRALADPHGVFEACKQDLDPEESENVPVKRYKEATLRGEAWNHRSPKGR
jgi:hypothetical protein